ncbi:MAG TPA: carboxypeptidase regulatory-like domain-containing protein [Bacteroidota bacterium]|nr:carboxypeptidase regulatory-like domain-containing protein [Bacteroidota bacterium]
MRRVDSRFLLIAGLTLLAGTAFAQIPPPTHLTAKGVPSQGDYDWGLSLSVQLAWMEVLPGAVPWDHVAFRIYRSVDDSTSFAPLSVTGDRSFSDHDVLTGHTYFYYVTAFAIAHDTASHESGKSNTAWAQVLPPPGHVTGTVAGTVTDSVTGTPIPGVRIRFFRDAHDYDDGMQVRTDSLGRYSARLDTGTYLILAQPGAWPDLSMKPVLPYRPKWYLNATEPSHAAPVTVADSMTFTANFALVHPVVPVRVNVRGTVRDSAGNALRGATVLLLRTIQQMQQMAEVNGDAIDAPGETADFDDIGRLYGVMAEVKTDSSGNYDATVLSGSPYVALAEKKGFVPQFFDHKSQPADATILLIAHDTSGIDFNLDSVRPPETYAISGAVRDSAGVAVPSRIVVFPLPPRPEGTARFASTDSMGLFTVQKVRAGKYIILALPYGAFAPAFYKAGAFGVMHWKDADTVTVAGDVTGIDIGVVPITAGGFASLRGSVESGGTGLAGVNVFGQSADGSIGGYALTDNSGAYEIDGLAPGVTTVIVDAEGYDPVQQQIAIGATDYVLSGNFSLSQSTSSIPVGGGASGHPGDFVLEQNYPNPFNPTTTISFSVPVASGVTIRVYSILGQEVATLVDGPFAAGSHTAIWNGRDSAGRVVASGVYFYRMEATGLGGGGSFTSMRRMLFLK